MERHAKKVRPLSYELCTMVLPGPMVVNHLILQGRNRRHRLMALATQFDTIAPLMFYYWRHLLPMATLLTWFNAIQLIFNSVFTSKNCL